MRTDDHDRDNDGGGGGGKRRDGMGMDGEAVKEEFKRRFRVVEDMLGREEKEKVMREAVRVMEEIVGVAGEIEGAVGQGVGMEEGLGEMGKGDNDRNDDSGGASMKKPLVAERQSWAQEREQDVSVRWLLLKHLLPLGLADLILAGFGGVLRLGFPDRSLGRGDIGSEGISLARERGGVMAEG